MLIVKRFQQVEKKPQNIVIDSISCKRWQNNNKVSYQAYITQSATWLPTAEWERCLMLVAANMAWAASLNQRWGLKMVKLGFKEWCTAKLNLSTVISVCHSCSPELISSGKKKKTW